jgi:hypothetical protein
LICNHCSTAFHHNPNITGVAQDVEGIWAIEDNACPECNKSNLYLINEAEIGSGTRSRQIPSSYEQVSRRMIRPKGTARKPVPNEVPKEIAEDYEEACLVLPDSPKASAALSRRCLQSILHGAAGIDHGNLHNEIGEASNQGGLPTYLAEDLHAVREIGNFAAHPNKSSNTGEIVAVEPEEADWNLEVIESLFDFYYVQPARAKAKRDSLNQKLDDAGRKPI